MRIFMNEEEITFNYHSDRHTLRAIAHNPLIILNNSLDYQITYNLDKFEYDKVHKTTSFSGNIIFNLDMATNRKSRKEFVLEDLHGKKSFAYHKNLEIAYDYHLTTVFFRNPKVYSGRDGFFEPEAILWYGYMSMARIADWLPYEYSPGSLFNIQNQ